MSTLAPSEPSDHAALDAARAKWLRTVEAELKGASFEKKLLTRTFEGVTLRPLYTRSDVAGRSPGEAALARHAGYAGGGWEVAQEIAAATPAEFNRRLIEDLMNGQNAAVVPEAFAGALAEALAGVELAVIPVHVDAGAEASAAGAELLALAAKGGVAGRALRGSVTADPLGFQAREGGLPAAYPVLLDALAGWTKRAAKEAPALRTIGVNAALWAEAGGTAAQELAGALASVAEYLRALAERGVAAETVLPRLKVGFSSGPQFLMETAKFRAWRPLLARVVAAFGADPALAAKVSVHAATARWNLTRLDPHVNMLRVTTEALAAVLGGVDALHISPFDGVGGAGSGEAFPRRIARNVHALLAEEFGFAAPADAAGGSWCIERLTDELARKAWEIFRGIEAAGGLPATLRSGEVQKMLAAAATEKARAAGSRKLGLIGTNLFPNLRETPLAPAPASAAKAAATCERVTRFAAFRVAAGFEALRDASTAFAARTGAKPRVFLAKMGPVAQHKARADFAAGFFAPGGFEPVAKESFATAAEAAAAVVASSAQVAVLCSTDDTYPELVPVFAAAVRAARPEMTLVLAGLPADESVRAQFAAAGIDVFIHLRASVEETLAQLLKKIGAL
jgi:methylmalonyl-CoA mutase